jgi:CubicO group peptidase (beta-lactamase class C family)
MGLATLDRLLSETAGRIPGVVVAVSDRDGLIYEGAAGVRQLGEEAAMTADTIFWIASSTKAITTAAALQCVERGQLTLDGPAAAILPELADLPVLDGFDAAAQPILRAARTPITLRQLLTHTSGLGYNFFNSTLDRYCTLAGIPDVLTCENAALTVPLLFDPGTRWEYGSGIDFAGKMVEAVSGLTIGQYLAVNIFAPLGMSDTGFRLSGTQKQRAPGMHARAPDGTLSPIPFELPEHPEFEMGGGGLRSTASDYLRFARMILNDGKAEGHQILKPETLALMKVDQIGGLPCGVLRSDHPGISNPVDFFPGMRQHWSLGFLMNAEAVPGGRAANSLAWAGLTNVYYWIDPSRGVAAVVAAQILPFFDAEVVGLLRAVEQAVYAELR